MFSGRQLRQDLKVLRHFRDWFSPHLQGVADGSAESKLILVIRCPTVWFVHLRSTRGAGWDATSLVCGRSQKVFAFGLGSSRTPIKHRTRNPFYTEWAGRRRTWTGLWRIYKNTTTSRKLQKGGWILITSYMAAGRRRISYMYEILLHTKMHLNRLNSTFHSYGTRNVRFIYLFIVITPNYLNTV